MVIQIDATIGHYIRAADPTQYHPGDGGAVQTGEQSGGGELQRALVKILLTDVPAGSTINSVTLDLYLTNLGATANNRTMRAFRIKRALTYESSWNNYDTGLAWQTAGATGANDIEAESGNKGFTTGDTLNQYHSMTLTASHIQDMLDGGYTNNGFLLKMDTENNDLYIFDGAAASNPPRLTIDYTPPPAGRSFARIIGA